MSKIDLTQSFIVKGAELGHLAFRPLPNAPDGYYDYQALAAGETNGKSEQHSRLYNVVESVQESVKRGPLVTNPKAEGIIDFFRNQDAIDDRRGFFVNSLSAISKMAPGPVANKLNDEAITLLYNTVPHPPATFLGSQYRSADGSNNSIFSPDLGKAGTPYARSVQAKHPQPTNMLPDPGLVFDTLLKARDFQEHPGKNSSLTFAFASLVTHSLFRTDPRDWNKNNTSSYLDLSPVYGYNQITQDLVRNKDLGRGLLYPDTFSEERLGFLPAAVSALLVIFSRNHNYIADMLLKINERKRWTNPPPADEKARLAQDEEIFQTARLVNCGHFMALIFGDYVAGFLGLGRDGNTWSMDAFDRVKMNNGDLLPRGQGNQVSVEFNVLYRWHATTAKEDVKWTEESFNRLFKGKPLDKVTLKDFGDVARDAFNTIDPDPKTRTFGGLKRNADGYFSDDDLAGLLHDATEKCAGAYRARGTPAALRVIEIMGIEQSRQWGVCTMNEFRRFLGLKALESFEEWNPDKEIANAARLLYGHIDNLELYTGLQAEACMPLGPGSGICCGYTMTRAILGDAIALVRGDRFYTTDYTPQNLTSWGYQDCARDPDNGAFGAALPKLLFRHLPRHYPANSVYALFPFFTPTVTKQNLTKLGLADKYDFNRPKATPVPKVLNTLTGIRHVFADYTKYKTIYTADMKLLTNDYGFFLVFDEYEKHTADKAIVIHALFPDNQSLARYSDWYAEKYKALIAEKSYKYDGIQGNFVDIVKDVINLASVHWAADMLCGIPLKTKANPKGLFTEQEVSDMFSLLFSCVFENIAPEHGWVLRYAASQVGAIVNGLIEQSLNEVAPKTASNPLVGFFTQVSQKIWPTVPKECHPFLGKLAASGRPTKDLVACVIGLAVGSSVNFSQAVAQVVDFYLDEKNVTHRKEIERLIKTNDKASDEKLQGYVREAMRFNPQFGGLFRAVAEDDVIPQGDGLAPLPVKKGDLIFSSFKNAHQNPADFPNPEKVDPTRSPTDYQLQGAGFHNCPGVDFAQKNVIPRILRIIFSLPNLRRAPGPKGVLASFIDRQFETDNRMYVTFTGAWSPWPGSFHVAYD
ncbi:heme peroxidase [Rickenella mellea]|uniref:Heme peroxidase n=1 Tax=Rickenella mellea TaxID=50990 RepID=A0A4Y7QFK9_9AGAM|nr:heme peroxidase [Rickenella mellea]